MAARYVMNETRTGVSKTRAASQTVPAAGARADTGSQTTQRTNRHTIDCASPYKDFAEERKVSFRDTQGTKCQGADC